MWGDREKGVSPSHCGNINSCGGFNSLLESFPDDHLTIVILMNARSGSGPSVALGTAISRLMLGLPEEKTLQDLPVPKEELAALAGTYDSDEGTVEQFARDGKQHFWVPGTQIEGVLLRQAANIYVVGTSEIHFLVRPGHPPWAIAYVGGLMMDAKPRVTNEPSRLVTGHSFGANGDVIMCYFRSFC